MHVLKPCYMQVLLFLSAHVLWITLKRSARLNYNRDLQGGDNNVTSQKYSRRLLCDVKTIWPSGQTYGGEPIHDSTKQASNLVYNLHETHYDQEGGHNQYCKGNGQSYIYMLLILPLFVYFFRILRLSINCVWCTWLWVAVGIDLCSRPRWLLRMRRLACYVGRCGQCRTLSIFV